MSRHKIAIINGPNLDRLGKREPDVYGTQTLDELISSLTDLASELGVDVEAFQSNHEGDIIDKISSFADAGVTGLIINPGGLTHTSVALRDSIAGSGLKTIEVHISNICCREEYRQHSITADACVGVISGLGFEGYSSALRYLSKA